MNPKWTYIRIRDWTLFIWRRFPTMLRAEFEYRVFKLVGFNRIHGWWNQPMMSQRLSLIEDNFAMYMAVSRENELLERNPDCWGGDDA